jgi:hypothetical protein
LSSFAPPNSLVARGGGAGPPLGFALSALPAAVSPTLLSTAITSPPAEAAAAAQGAAEFPLGAPKGLAEPLAAGTNPLPPSPPSELPLPVLLVLSKLLTLPVPPLLTSAAAAAGIGALLLRLWRPAAAPTAASAAAAASATVAASAAAAASARKVSAAEAATARCRRLAPWS